MRNRRSIRFLLCFMASLLVPGIVSASTTADAETHVWAFDPTDHVRVGVERSTTRELHLGCGHALDDIADAAGFAAMAAELGITAVEVVVQPIGTAAGTVRFVQDPWNPRTLVALVPFVGDARKIAKLAGAAGLATTFVKAEDRARDAARGASSRILGNSTKQLQRKFKHAGDFGVTGNYSRANAAEFGRALNQHINSDAVRAISGTYRGNPVTHYLDPGTGLNVIADRAGNFVSGWRLGGAQLQNVLSRGRL